MTRDEWLMIRQKKYTELSVELKVHEKIMSVLDVLPFEQGGLGKKEEEVKTKDEFINGIVTGSGGMLDMSSPMGFVGSMMMGGFDV